MGKGARTKGYLKDLKRNAIKQFMFNPEMFSDSQAFNYAVISGPCSSYPNFQYTGTGERTISVQLFLYGDSDDIQSWMNFLEGLKPKKRFDAPSEVLFAFGNYVKRCVITNSVRDRLQFDTDLKATYMMVSLSLMEVQ